MAAAISGSCIAPMRMATGRASLLWKARSRPFKFFHPVLPRASRHIFRRKLASVMG